jgi:hypothetical protein
MIFAYFTVTYRLDSSHHLLLYCTRLRYIIVNTYFCAWYQSVLTIFVVLHN